MSNQVRPISEEIVPPSRPSALTVSFKKSNSRCLLLVLFYCSVVWNTLSPFKSWMLGRYALVDGGQIDISKMNWSVPMDPVFLNALYEKAGVPQQPQRVGKPERFINLYLDFMIHQKSRRWAPYVNDQHKDEYAGRYCRTGLKYNRAKQFADMLKFSNTGVKLWGEMFYIFLIDQKTCRVSEVPEALLCLKGYRGLDLLNLEWSTNLKVTDPEVIEGLTGWQAKLMPDLESCIARRHLLIAENGYHKGLISLSEEISKNYSLILENVAGLSQSYAQLTQEKGFIDISGYKSGKRTAQLNGHLYSRNLKDLDGDLNAMTVIRETLWTCTIVRPPNQKFSECLLQDGFTVPAVFQLKYLHLKSVGSRQLENRLFQKRTIINNLTEYTLTPIKMAAKKNYEYIDEKFFQSKVESEYKKIYHSIVEKKYGIKPATLKGGIKVCLVNDDCLNKCNSITSVGRWTLVFKRSGICQTRRISSDLINSLGYVSKECLGFGTGNSTLYLENDKHTEYNVTIKQIADPSAIVACILGGRIPSGEFFPAYFLDSIEPGTGSVMMSVLVDGSEKTLLNFYSLITLVGCFCFGFWVILEAYLLQTYLRKSAKSLSNKDYLQASHGIYLSNIASRVWNRYYYRMQIVGLISIISWFLGAINSKCTWSKVQNGSGISPTYSCHAGQPFHIFSSFGEIVRLFSASYVFFAAVFQWKKEMTGITRSMKSYAATILFFGVIPCIACSVAITWINILRFRLDIRWLHNQLFITVMWLLSTWVWSNVLDSSWMRIGFNVLNLVGQKRQAVQSGCLVHEFVGDFYWERAEYVQEHPIAWIPLSVFVELPTGDLAKISWFNRRILPDGNHSLRYKATVPNWIDHDQDFYIG